MRGSTPRLARRDAEAGLTEEAGGEGVRLLLGEAAGPGEDRLEELAGEGLGDAGDVLGRALGDDLAAAVAALGAEVDRARR